MSMVGLLFPLTRPHSNRPALPCPSALTHCVEKGYLTLLVVSALYLQARTAVESTTPVRRVTMVLTRRVHLTCAALAPPHFPVGPPPRVACTGGWLPSCLCVPREVLRFFAPRL